MVGNGAFSHKIDYFTIFQENQNLYTSSRVTAILLNRLIFPIVQSGEASRWRVCYQWGLPRLVYENIGFYCDFLASCEVVRGPAFL